MFASVGKHVMRRQRALHLGLRWRQPFPLQLPLSGSASGSSYTEATELPPRPPQLENPHSFWARAGVALPSLGYLESGSDILVFAGTRCPKHTGHTSEEEYLLWVLHLPADPMCARLQDRKSDQAWLWASQGLWSSPVHRCSDLPQRGRHLPAERRGAAKLKSRRCFPPSSSS